MRVDEDRDNARREAERGMRNFLRGAGDLIWVGTPHDVIERIEAVQEECEGLTEVSIAVNAGGFAHWQAIKTQEIFAHKVMSHFRL